MEEFKEREETIVVPAIPYLKEVWRKLYRGGFISRVTLSREEEKIFEYVEEHYDVFSSYFGQMDYYLERGDGVFYLCDLRRTNVNMVSKFRSDVSSLLPLVYIMNEFNCGLRAGDEYDTYEFVRYCLDHDNILSVIRKNGFFRGTTDEEKARFITKWLANNDYVDVYKDGMHARVKSAFSYLREYYLRIPLLKDSEKFNTGQERRFEMDKTAGEVIPEESVDVEEESVPERNEQEV